MSVIARRLRRRLGSQDGFVLMFALGIMLIVMLLTGALLLAVDEDNGLGSADTSGKQAYAAAQAGAQAFLFELNHNSAASKFWQTCTNDASSAPVAVPGATGETYTYQPVAGEAACKATGAIGTVLNTTNGQLQMEFKGTAGTATRTLAVAYRTLTPLSYLWFTQHETVDPVVPGSGGTACENYYWSSTPPPSSCEINWFTGDQVKGPMYTHDEFLIDGTPSFGRNAQDVVASATPTGTGCINPYGSSVKCPGPGTPQAQAPDVPLAKDNANLEQDASTDTNGDVAYGATLVTLTANRALVNSCVPSGAQSGMTCTAKTIIGSVTDPITIYAANAPGGCSATYDPTNVPAIPKQPVSTCGDVYLTAGSNFSVPVTIAAQDDIVIEGNVTNAAVSGTTMPLKSNPAVLGLVADQFVRVAHPQGQSCGSTPDPDVTIDAAILTLQNSFFVDNYECGNGSYGQLTVNGAIAQEYRGIVGTSAPSGYLKNYNYDNRLAYLLPPDLFDLSDASWQVVRETLCGSDPSLGVSNPQSCTYNGS